MHRIVFLFMVLLSLQAKSALEYSKIDFPGCPENAYCQKNTGEVRKSWLDLLDNFNRNKISESKMNSEIQQNFGVPISGWAMEEAGVLPRIMMWDSPCPQHKKEATKFYISDFFRKNLKASELKEYNNVYFPKAIGIDNLTKKAYSIIIPRGDTPTFSSNGYLNFLRDDEGKYYGLLVNREGDIKVTKPEVIPELPKEAVCLKEQIDLFNREAPSTSFYQSYFCKDIWDKNSKTYKTMLFGWSCH